MKPTASPRRHRPVQRSGRRPSLHPRPLVELLEARALLSATPGNLAFNNTPLILPDGASEPAIAIAAGGATALTALSWQQNFTNLWTGSFGKTPDYKGAIDSKLQQVSKAVFGGGDADVDIGSTGTIHATTLVFLVNPTFQTFQLGVSAITIKNGDTTAQIIDTAGADRPWITSDGPHVWISYHDAGNSSLVHVQRSDDDGLTWHRVGDPIPGQGTATGDATFNNSAGPIVADPSTHNLYVVYAAGQPGIQKGTSATFNNIYVARSTDLGVTWTTTLVYHAPLFTALNNVFPSLAVDPTNGKLYATWSDGQTVSLAASSDRGAHWSPATAVNAAPATTAIFPWVAAYGGTVDVVYYATTAASDEDPTAVWNVYLAQKAQGGTDFTQSKVSDTPNHVGVICTSGTACGPGTRNLLDLFEVAIDPDNGLAGVIYTDDTRTQTPSGAPLPQVVLAYQTGRSAATAPLTASTSSSPVAATQTTSAPLGVPASALQSLLPMAGVADQLATSSGGPSMPLIKASPAASVGGRDAMRPPSQLFSGILPRRRPPLVAPGNEALKRPPVGG